MASARPRTIALSIAVVCLALTGCTATAHPASAPLATTFPKGVLTAEPDSGSARDRAAVRTATVAAMTSITRSFVVPVGLRGKAPATVLAAVTSTSANAARADLLARDRSPDLAAALEKSFAFYASQEFGPAWTGSGGRAAWLDRDVWSAGTFHVDRWQGVQVAGDTARVLVRGEDHGTSWSGRERVDAWAQYQLILHRDATAPHGWRVVRQQAASTAA